LPSDAPTRYSMQSPFPDQRIQTISEFSSKNPITFELQPFEVLVFEARPKK